MTVNRNKLVAVLFFMVMGGAFSAYSQSDFMLVSGSTMSYDERQKEIFQNIKVCTGLKDVRFFQSKSVEVLNAWTKLEIEKSDRITWSFFDKETGIYTAMSLPDARSAKEIKKSMKSKENIKTNDEMVNKVKNCLSTADIRVIETKNSDMLGTWMKTEDENRNISTFFSAETGVYTAISSPKTDGQGKVLFKKID